MKNNINYLMTSPYIYVYKKGEKTWTIVSYLHEKIYTLDFRDIELLEFCKRPRSVDEIKDLFPNTLISTLIKRNLLVNTKTVWDQYCIKYVEIEINLHCNYRCRYCPNQYHKKPHKYMNMDLYGQLINQLTSLNTVEYVTFHGYNEPLLDIFFEERIKLLARNNIKLVLFTNASLMNQEVLSILKKSNILKLLKINFPTLDEKRYAYMTGSNKFNEVKKNIDYAIQQQLPVQIICNGTDKDFKENLEDLKNYYKDITVSQHATNDRTGLLKNEYSMNYHFTKKLCGCSQVTNWLHVGVDGEVYLCYMDYYKKNILGDLCKSTLQDILSGPQAVELRKTVAGFMQSDENWICRHCFQNYISRVLMRNTKQIRPEAEDGLI